MSGAAPDPEWDDILALMGAATQRPPEALRERVLSASTPPPFTFVRRSQGIWLPVGGGAHAKALFLDSRDRWSTRVVRLADDAALPPAALGGRCVVHIVSGALSDGHQELAAGDVLADADPGARWRSAGDTELLELCFAHLPAGSPRALHGSAVHWQSVSDGIRVAPVEGNWPGILLVDARAGAVLPEHTHEGVEELFVLRGSCVVQGEVMESGDYHRALPGSSHQPTTAESAGCLLFTALRIDNAA